MVYFFVIFIALMLAIFLSIISLIRKNPLPMYPGVSYAQGTITDVTTHNKDTLVTIQYTAGNLQYQITEILQNNSIEPIKGKFVMLQYKTGDPSSAFWIANNSGKA
jgi:hypothetical protein